jgi:hypothetical protein
LALLSRIDPLFVVSEGTCFSSFEVGCFSRISRKICLNISPLPNTLTLGMKNYRRLSGDGPVKVVLSGDSNSPPKTTASREPLPYNSPPTQEVCSPTLVGEEVTSLTSPSVRMVSVDYRTHQRNVDCRPIRRKKARNVAYCRITEKISETLFPSDLASPLAQNVDFPGSSVPSFPSIQNPTSIRFIPPKPAKSPRNPAYPSKSHFHFPP